MKFALLIPISLLLAACAAKPARVMDMGFRAVPGNMLPSQGVASVRYAENLRAYPLGRYVDPGNSRIMHEGHSIYRVETTARWNLHPNEFAPVPRGPIRVRDSARNTLPVGDELLAEFNQQKEATKAIVQGGQAVSQKLGELAEKVQQTQQMAAQSAQLKQEVDTARRRLDALEEELRRNPPPSTPQRSQPENKSDW